LTSAFHLIAATLVQEFAQLTSGNTVYKLIGPVLVKQDQAEAKSNVNTRLDFIRSEMSGFSPNSTSSELINKPCSQRVEGQIKDVEQKQEKKKAEVSFLLHCSQFAIQSSTISTARPDPNGSSANIRNSCFNINALRPSHINPSA
jgi:hypothetical protein